MKKQLIAIMALALAAILVWGTFLAVLLRGNESTQPGDVGGVIEPSDPVGPEDPAEPEAPAEPEEPEEELPAVGTILGATVPEIPEGDAESGDALQIQFSMDNFNIGVLNTNRRRNLSTMYGEKRMLRYYTSFLMLRGTMAGVEVAVVRNDECDFEFTVYGIVHRYSELTNLSEYFNLTVASDRSFQMNANQIATTDPVRSLLEQVYGTTDLTLPDTYGTEPPFSLIVVRRTAWIRLDFELYP